MTTYEEALASILEATRTLPKESVALADALGRHLANDIVAAFDSPRFDNSAVDGFAVLAEDIESASDDSPIALRVVETVFAGADTNGKRLKAGGTARTMTGAAVIEGANAVVMQEDVVLDGDIATFRAPTTMGQSVRKRAEDYRQGEVLVTAGTCCSPAVLALAASQGTAQVEVSKSPRVAVIVTGSELVEPGSPLKEGQIYESNSIALSTAARSLGAKTSVQSVADDPDQTREAFARAVEDNDFIVFSGGASVGEKDLVRAILLESGVREKFWKISMKPGKPVFFGTKEGILVFALPGNPVSAQVTFELLVVPALLKASGAHRPEPKTESAVLKSRITRRAGRKEFLRAQTTIDKGRIMVEAVRQQESHMVSGLAMADRLIVVESDVDCIEAGDTVQTVPLKWRLPV